jgi:hypothetical protein
LGRLLVFLNALGVSIGLFAGSARGRIAKLSRVKFPAVLAQGIRRIASAFWVIALLVLIVPATMEWGRLELRPVPATLVIFVFAVGFLVMMCAAFVYVLLRFLTAVVQSDLLVSADLAKVRSRAPNLMTRGPGAVSTENMGGSFNAQPDELYYMNEQLEELRGAGALSNVDVGEILKEGQEAEYDFARLAKIARGEKLD